MAADVVELTSATTVNGQKASIKIVDGKVMIDGAQIVKTDIECGNGVIHVIDSVIMPKKQSLTMAFVESNPAAFLKTEARLVC